MLGGDGNDYIEGAGGADILNGGLGIDTLSYENSTAAVNVNMTQLILGNITVSGGLPMAMPFPTISRTSSARRTMI
ncbi:hypothetical protein [Phyllobacterium endophyticum]|uniref:hypothetical protein n=1 Tax=Phyllobacterium endophyticum TaxID=1149773 RepID=UPI003CCEE90C